MIEGQIGAAYQAKSHCLEEDVQWMRKQNEIANLRKDLLKEKDNLVWGFGQSKRSEERRVGKEC